MNERAAVDDLAEHRKMLATLRACLARAGYRLDRVADRQGFRIQRGQWLLDVADLHAVVLFAQKAGIWLPTTECPP